MDALDDHDDVQSVAANFNIPDEAMAAIESGRHLIAQRPACTSPVGLETPFLGHFWLFALV